MKGARAVYCGAAYAAARLRSSASLSLTLGAAHQERLKLREELHQTRDGGFRSRAHAFCDAPGNLEPAATFKLGVPASAGGALSRER
jgi:hypothetical protein